MILAFLFKWLKEKEEEFIKKMKNRLIVLLFMLLLLSACSPMLVDRGAALNMLTQAYGKGFESFHKLMQKGNYSYKDISRIEVKEDSISYVIKEKIKVHTKTFLEGNSTIVSESAIVGPANLEYVNDIANLIGFITSDELDHNSVESIVKKSITERATQYFKNGKIEVINNSVKVTLKFEESL